MDADIFPVHASTVTRLSQVMGAEKAEAFGHHAGRAVEVASGLHASGAVSGFLLQFADRRAFGCLAFVIVADKARGQFDAAAAERHPELIDQQDVSAPVRIFVDGQDNGSMDTARLGGVLLWAAFLAFAANVIGTVRPWARR